MIYSRGSTASQAIEAFTAGFDQLGAATIDPAQQQSLVDYYAKRFAKDENSQTGENIDVDALLPTSAAQRYLQANYTVPFGDYNAPSADWDAAIKFDDARDGSPWSAANARFNDFFREIVTRFDFEDALLLDTRGNVVYSAYKGVDLGTNVLTGPFKGSELGGAYQKALDIQHRRLRRPHGLRRLPTGRRADRMVRVARRTAGQGGRRSGAAVPDLQDQQADDDGRSLAGLRHGPDGRDVHRRPRRPDEVQFPAVPRRSRCLQARRHRRGHSAGRRRGRDPAARHHPGAARGDRGHQAGAAGTTRHARSPTTTWARRRCRPTRPPTSPGCGGT